MSALPAPNTEQLSVVVAAKILTELAEIRNILESSKSTPDVLNFEQTRAFLGCSKSFLYKLTSTGAIPHSKPRGKQVYFDKRELEKWLLMNKTTSGIITHESTIEQQAADYVAFGKKKSRGVAHA